MNNNFECTDCEHCLPDSEGPTSKGICLLDPEFEPYLEEIVEFDFSNCHHLVRKKSFDFNCRACSDFTPAEEVEMIDSDDSGEQENDLDMQKVDFKNLPVEPYLQDLYSSSGSKRQEAVNTLGSLTHLGNDQARDVLLAFLKELGPPETLEQAGFKAETLRHFHGRESSQDLLELLLSDLENTTSNNSTRQWITAILDFLGRAPLERIESRLQSMVDRKIFSHRLQKRVLSVIDPMNRDYD